MTLGETASYVRSKNAGPFWMTIDIFCCSEAAYRQIKAAESLKSAAVAAVYHVKPQEVKRFVVDVLKVLQISMPRPYPQGACCERDMHSGQQYVQLLDAQV